MQWFVGIKPLAAPGIRAVEDARIRFVPENWSGVYYEWMHIKLVHQPQRGGVIAYRGGKTPTAAGTWRAARR